MHIVSGNSCYNSPCQNGGTCTNQGSGYRCSCRTGYTGSTCATSEWNL